MNNIICIAGPTASGKTALAVKLAKELNGEVISCDSMQVYKRMDIGTAKPTHEEMQGIFPSAATVPWLAASWTISWPGARPPLLRAARAFIWIP